MRSQAERALPAIAALAFAGLLALLLAGSTFISSDGAIALAWGGELARGAAPDVTAPLLPVFHPLPTLVGAALHPFGPDAVLDGYRALSILSLAGLAYAAFRLGRDLAGAGAGLLAAALLLSRPEVMSFALSSAIDIPFTALVLLAAALAFERPRGNRWWVLGLLALAGLLRPEAWVLSVAYAAWLVQPAANTPVFGRLRAVQNPPHSRPAVPATEARGRELAGLGALGLAGPLIWFGFDLWLAGDPLGSVSRARVDFDAEVQAAGYASVGSSDPAGVSGLADLLGRPLAVGAVAAALLLAWGGFRARERPEGRRTLAAAALALAMLFAPLALDALGFNFSIRYLILPAAALTVLFSAALLKLATPVGRIVLAAAALGIAITLPGDLDEVRDLRSAGSFGERSLDKLQALAGSQRVARATEECEGLGTGGYTDTISRTILSAGVLAVYLELDPAEVQINIRPPAHLDSVLLLERQGGLGPNGPADPRRHIARRSPWVFWSRCGRGG